jgi:hypothetical protein
LPGGWRSLRRRRDSRAPESFAPFDAPEIALQENARSLIVERIATANFDFVSLDEPNQIGEAMVMGVLAFSDADDQVAK